MSDSTSLLTQLTTAQAGKEATVNELMNAVSQAAFGGRKQSSSGLSWDYFGGRIDVDGVTTAIANGTVTLTASTTNYVESTRAGVVSKNTTGFTAGNIALYKIVTGTATVTSYEDHRPWVKLQAGKLARSITSDANITLTHDESENNVLEFTSSVSLTVTRDVIVPLSVKSWIIYNNTTGGQSLRFIGASGTGATVASGAWAIICGDGTNVSLITSTAGSQPYDTNTPGKNRIINGDMRVDQRNNGATVTDANGYTLDRMYCSRTGGAAGMSVSRVYGANSLSKHTLRIQRANGNVSTVALNLYQPIEQQDTQDFAGNTVMMSVNIYCSASAVSTTATLFLFYQTTTTDQGVGGAWTQITGAAQTLAAGPAKYTQSFAVPSNATQVMAAIAFSCAGTAGADESRYVTEWQLEMGGTSTTFERKSIADALLLCLRFYNAVTTYVAALVSGTAVTGYAYPTPMRAAPAITGGGAGYTTVSPTDRGTYHYQTATSSQSLVLNSEL